jgi:hypothetical protein
VDRALKAHLDSAAASFVEEMEGDSLGAGGREELDRNRRKPEVDIEILQRAEAWFLAIRSWGGPRAARDAEVRRHAEAIVRLLEGGMMTTAATASSTRLSPAVDTAYPLPLGITDSERPRSTRRIR